MFRKKIEQTAAFKRVFTYLNIARFITSFALFPHLKLFTRFVKTAKESPPSQNRTRSFMLLRLNDLTKTGIQVHHNPLKTM